MGSKYGDWLKEQREAAGLTQQELADRAIMTRSHISHIEAGRRVPSKDDAKRLDRALNTGNVLQTFLPRTDVVIADYFESALELEQQATVIREFAPSLVPGILQTEPYMRGVIGAVFPPWSAEECDKLVVTRLNRAKILTDPTTPMVWALLDEAVLRRPVGGPEVMLEQIQHLIGLAESGRVRIHVLPLGLGVHSLLPGMLSLMSFEDQPPAAYTEGLYTGTLHDSPAIVEQLQGTYDLALGDALPIKESLALMRAAAKDYGHHD
ncbi:helix-turn-helix transcriptional regulator [Streptomyces sp. NA04227]|uniref:helix-turn-helix domain-containing protein n=1 Tax=Streptomyces sp. NA04227 TaxID=2742136 RepID=UPI00158FD76B|nr:helix-turn-helix transcriptional regulator [Streptomyces sp. NA04227]QKW06550.1 helix-turn-helix transcriptional regulator [Streptomyces sp. NA04227]